MPRYQVRRLHRGKCLRAVIPNRICLLYKWLLCGVYRHSWKPVSQLGFYLVVSLFNRLMSIVAVRIAVEANWQLSSNDLTTILFMSTQGSRFEATCQGCDTTCQGCFVEDNTSVPTCAEMFEHAQSKNGSATIEGVIVDPGYWRADNKSEKVLPCYNPEACRGGLTGDPGYCNDGYQGPCEFPSFN